MIEISENLKAYSKTAEIVDELLDSAKYARLNVLAERRINETSIPIECFKRIIGEGELEKYAPHIGVLEDRVKMARLDLENKSRRDAA